MTKPYIHSFAKVWLDKLENEILINGTNFFEEDIDKLHDKFEISPLKSCLYVGQSLVDEGELDNITNISFPDLKKKLGLTVYKIPVGDMGWKKNQKDILVIGRKGPGIPNELPESTFRRRALKIERNRAENWVRGVGENFGTIKGRYIKGDITPEIYYETRRKKSHNINPIIKLDSYSQVNDDWYKARRGEELNHNQRILIKELPVMISDGELICIPKTKVLPKILAVGRSRGGKCQPAGSKVLMADGTWKKIENIMVGDEIISPQIDGSNIFSKVVDTTSWYSFENYMVRQLNKQKRALYSCSHNHPIPVFYRVSPRINGKRPKELAYWEIRNYEANQFYNLSHRLKKNLTIGFSSFPIEEYKGRENCIMEPYTLGLYIAEGSYSYKKANYNLGIATTSQEIINYISKYYPYSFLNKKAENSLTYKYKMSSKLARQLDHLGLKNKKSGDKFIPKQALLSDIEYRKKLLAGLIDGDGYSRHGGYQITSKSKKLAEDILDLVYSLGGRGNINKVKKGIKKLNFVGEYYCVSFYLGDLKLPLLIKYKIRTCGSTYLEPNRIALDLDKIGPCQVYGIQIDSPSNLYITDNWMVTHNTFSIASLIGKIFYMWQDRVGIVNDSLDQFYNLSLPQDLEGFKKELSRINQKPRNIPAINMYMSCPNLKMRYQEERIDYRLVISFKDFLKRWDFYSIGVEKWKIGGPFKYVSREIINEVSKKRTTAEIRKYFFAKFTEMQGDGKELEKGKREMLMKWCAAIDKVLSDQFTDNLFQHEETTSPQWTLVRKDGTRLTSHPFIVAFEAGLVPVINNFLAKNKPIAIKQIADLLNKIVEHQMLVEEKKRVWIFIDELKDFLKHKRGNVLYTALDEIFTQGARNNIGFCGTIQEYSKLTNSMRNNLTHLLIFDMKSKDERKKVAADLELDKERMEELDKLGKHQCLFVTSEDTVVYTKDGQRKVVVGGGIWKGIVPPPLTHYTDTGE